MTVALQSGITTVGGDGATTVFSFPFIAVAPVYLSVLYTDPNGFQTLLQQGSGPGQYQVTMGLPPPGGVWGIGGTITYNPNGTPIPMGSLLTIMRTLPVQQPVSMVTLGSLATLGYGAEVGDDLIVLLLQQYTDALARCLQMNPANLVPPLVLPPAAQIAGQLAAFDSTGNNMIAAALLPQGMVSSVMQPVIDAASLTLARAALGVPGQLTVQYFTASGLYTPPAGLLWAIVECMAGGGGGGAAIGNLNSGGGGGGGGGGGYSRAVLTAATQIGTNPINVTVGLGGAGGLVGIAGPGGGGGTTFGSLCSANGGSPAEPFDPDGEGVWGQGGDGGEAAGAVGTLVLAGQPGGNGCLLGINGSATMAAVGGIGGAMFGGAGECNGPAGPGGSGFGRGAQANSGAGGGGGAAYGSSSAVIQVSGGAGGNGWCLVTEFSS